MGCGDIQNCGAVFWIDFWIFYRDLKKRFEPARQVKAKKNWNL